MEGGIAMLVDIRDVGVFIGSAKTGECPFPVFLPEAPHPAEKIIMQANPAAGLPWIEFCHIPPLVSPFTP
jgi:hypothetical protein